jgi:hypothetical protein
MTDGPLNDLTLQRLKDTEEVMGKWDKLYEYIKPYITYDEEYKKLAQEIQSYLVLQPIGDLMFVTAVHAERLAILSMINKGVIQDLAKETEEK